MDPDKFLSMVTAIVPFNGKDIHVTVSDLLTSYPNLTVEKIAKAVYQLPDAKIADRNAGGITIPAKYFET